MFRVEYVWNARAKKRKMWNYARVRKSKLGKILPQISDFVHFSNFSAGNRNGILGVGGSFCAFMWSYIIKNTPFVSTSNYRSRLTNGVNSIFDGA